MKISQREHEHRLVVDLPDLRHSDLVDMARLLQAITNAFSTHHQAGITTAMSTRATAGIIQLG